jgi:hypothetical protein
MIIEKQLKNLDNVPPKCNKKKPPRSINQSLPPLYHCFLSVGSKNSGKSYSVVKHLKNYEDYPIKDCEGKIIPQRIILFSPTADSPYNPIFKTLKNLNDNDIYTEYSDEILQDVLDDIEQVKNDIEERNEYINAYKKAIKIKKLENLDEETMAILEKYNFVSPDELPQLRYEIPPTNFIIFDDMISDPKVFKKNGTDLVSKLTIKHRHKQICLIYTTQYLKSVGPVIRKNCDIFQIFKYGDTKEVVDKFYSEISGFCKPDEFKEMYLYATEKPRNSLVIDIHPDTHISHRFKMNFDKLLLTEDRLPDLKSK